MLIFPIKERLPAPSTDSAAIYSQASPSRHGRGRHPGLRLDTGDLCNTPLTPAYILSDAYSVEAGRTVFPGFGSASPRAQIKDAYGIVSAIDAPPS